MLIACTRAYARACTHVCAHAYTHTLVIKVLTCNCKPYAFLFLFFAYRTKGLCFFYPPLYEDRFPFVYTV